MIEYSNSEALALCIVYTRTDVQTLTAVGNARTYQQRAVFYNSQSVGIMHIYRSDILLFVQHLLLEKKVVLV